MTTSKTINPFTGPDDGAQDFGDGVIPPDSIRARWATPEEIRAFEQAKQDEALVPRPKECD